MIIIKKLKKPIMPCSNNEGYCSLSPQIKGFIASRNLEELTDFIYKVENLTPAEIKPADKIYIKNDYSCYPSEMLDGIEGVDVEITKSLKKADILIIDKPAKEIFNNCCTFCGFITSENMFEDSVTLFSDITLNSKGYMDVRELEEFVHVVFVKNFKYVNFIYNNMVDYNKISFTENLHNYTNKFKPLLTKELFDSFIAGIGAYKKSFLLSLFYYNFNEYIFDIYWTLNIMLCQDIHKKELAKESLYIFYVYIFGTPFKVFHHYKSQPYFTEIFIKYCKLNEDLVRKKKEELIQMALKGIQERVDNIKEKYGVEIEVNYKSTKIC